MALYLLHGALGSAEQLSPLVNALVASGVEARTIELAGHGRTPLGAREFSVGTFVAQVRERLDADGCERPDFFGYSMGGYVALAFALSHADRTGGVMTLGTKFEWTPEIAEREASRLDPERMRAKVPQFAATLEERHAGAGGWTATLAATAGFLRRLGERPLLNEGELASIAPKVCVGVGDRDATVGVDESQRVSRRLAHGSLAVLPNTPHAFEQVDHALLATLVRRVFDR